jgi:hypothetical protein
LLPYLKQIYLFALAQQLALVNFLKDYQLVHLLMQLFNKPNPLNQPLILNKMKHVRQAVVLAMLLSPKPQKTNTEKEFSLSLDPSQLKKTLTLHHPVQPEKPLLEKLKNHQFVSKIMQTILLKLENVSKT